MPNPDRDRLALIADRGVRATQNVRGRTTKGNEDTRENEGDKYFCFFSVTSVILVPSFFDHLRCGNLWRH
jgi:hypothetical protein